VPSSGGAWRKYEIMRAIFKRSLLITSKQHLNRTSTSEYFDQIFCVSDSEDTPPLPCSRLSGSQNMLRFRVFLRDTSKDVFDG